MNFFDLRDDYCHRIDCCFFWHLNKKSRFHVHFNNAIKQFITFIFITSQKFMCCRKIVFLVCVCARACASVNIFSTKFLTVQFYSQNFVNYRSWKIILLTRWRPVFLNFFDQIIHYHKQLIKKPRMTGHKHSDMLINMIIHINLSVCSARVSELGSGRKIRGLKIVNEGKN